MKRLLTSLGVSVLVLVQLLIAAPTKAATTIAITSPSNSAVISGSSFTVTGTATANRTITVKVDGNTVGNTTSSVSGAWSLDVTGQTVGAKTVTATASTQLVYTNQLGPGGVGGSLMIKTSTFDNSQVGTFSIASGGSFPTTWLPNRNFTKAYGTAPLLNSSQAFVIDLQTETVANFTIAVTNPVGRSIAYNADYSKVYIADSANGVVRVYNTTTDAEVGAGITVGASPSAMVHRPNTDTIWALNPTDDTISVINTTTDTVTSTLASIDADAASLAFSPDGNHLYSGTVTGNLLELNTSTGATIQTSSSASISSIDDMIITSDGSTIYAVPFSGNAVAVFNSTSFANTANVSVANGTYRGAITADNSTVYVSSPDLLGGAVGTTLTAISTATNAVTGTITMTGAPLTPVMAPVESATDSISITLSSGSVLADTGANMYLYIIIAMGLILPSAYYLKRQFGR